MEIKLFSEEKTLNIETEIINRRSGTYRIGLSKRVQLDNVLDELHKRGLFDEYNMSYVYTVEEVYILLILHKAFDFIR